MITALVPFHYKSCLPTCEVAGGGVPEEEPVEGTGVHLVVLTEGA